VFARENLAAAVPSAWVGDEVFFSASRDTTNLWKAKLSPRTGKIAGSPRRLTFGTDQDGEPSVAANGSIVFSTVAANTNIWSLPVELNEG
jgi:hypothetical protein